MTPAMTHADTLPKVKKGISMVKGKRPTSVTVIAVILILSSCLLWLMPIRRLPNIKHLNQRDHFISLWGTVFGIIHLASGIAILKGRNWGRLLYLCSIPILIILDWVVFRYRRAFIFLISEYVASFAFLVRPAASAFFARTDSDE
jgi:hypothetical protein